MRVLVVGSYPPPLTPAGRVTMETVGRLAREGGAGGSVEVEVFSPEPSAAHHFGRVDGPRAAVEMAWRARRYDGLVVHVEPFAPLRPAVGRLAHLADCLLWGLCLRMAGHSTLVVDDLTRSGAVVGGRSGRLFWGAARRIVVTNEPDRVRIHGYGGVPLERIEVLAPAERRRPVAADDGQWDAAGDLDAIQDLVRSRAAVDRRPAP